MKNIPKSQLIHLEKKIAELIIDLNKAVTWNNKFLKGNQKLSTNNDVKRIRRRLKNIHFAIAQRPSAAMYGESQVGKSYLIKNLLSEEGQPFIIKNETDGKYYNFLEDLNPKGGGVESTSVVSRFSTDVEIIDRNFPIKIVLLNPKDVILMLADSYYEDIKKHKSFPKQEKLDEYITQVKDVFENSRGHQEVLTEDDVLDIRDYLANHFPNKPINDFDEFWNLTALNIHKVNYRNWVDIFQIIWNKNEDVNDIFSKLISTLKKIEFEPVVYTSFDAVLRDKGTLLDVERLRELNEQESKYDSSKYEKEASVISKKQKTPTFLEKSKLCALVAELVFKVDKELETQKPLLKYLDLLDFPGARSRLKNEEEELNEEHIAGMVLRGKVAYIFNKYSSQHLISNLLFCNNNKQRTASFIPELLNNWIKNFIGRDANQREKFLKHSPYVDEIPIPPLFVIYTFFNEDLKFDETNDKPGTLDAKWKKRFLTIFQEEFVTKNYNWNLDWSTSHSKFKNNYMLRDYLWSSTYQKELEKDDRGEVKVKKETTLISTPEYPNYFEDLEKSFLDYGFVNDHFMKPKQSWKESAYPNKDGSELIIRHLTLVSTNFARTQKFVRDLDELSKELQGIMNAHYHSDEADKRIIQASKKAGDIHFNMNVVFGKDPYAFGNFMKAFLIKESQVYNFYKERLTTLELIEYTNVHEYILIRNDNPELSISKSYEENIEVLIDTYKYSNQEEVELYFKEREIDLNELFYGEANQLKNNSLVLAEALRDFWFEDYLVKERFQYVINRGFKETALENLFENMRVSFDQLEITKIIAQNIRDYVDRFDKIDIAEEMIADISASIINKFTTSMAWDFYSKDKLDSLKSTNEANGLRLDFKAYSPGFKYDSDDAIAELFDNMNNYNEEISKININRAVVKNFPNIWNISRWTSLMKISFVANCDIPTYDVLANKDLGKILEHLDMHHFELGEAEEVY